MIALHVAAATVFLAVQLINLLRSSTRRVVSLASISGSAALLILSPNSLDGALVSWLVVLLVIDRKWSLEVEHDLNSRGRPLVGSARWAGIRSSLDPLYVYRYRRAMFNDAKSRALLSNGAANLRRPLGPDL